VWQRSMPGSAFAAGSLWCPFTNEIVKRGDEIVLLASYVGRLKKGRAFNGALIGTASRRRTKK
jgi:hypothetical protein